MEHIRKIFTKWYVKKGYTFGYKVENNMSFGTYFDCPIWVRPLLFLFSPSLYTYYVLFAVEKLKDSVELEDKE